MSHAKVTKVPESDRPFLAVDAMKLTYDEYPEREFTLVILPGRRAMILTEDDDALPVWVGFLPETCLQDFFWQQIDGAMKGRANAH